MLSPFRCHLSLALAALVLAVTARATNPLITDQFTADPTARVFGGKLYLYPSHDIKAPPDYPGRHDWFCMADYHVFSSENLTDWVDHGVIVTQAAVPWVDASKYSMWAPDCVEKGGKYYFFFPALAKTGGFRIGVAIADQPTGPFQPQAAPIASVRGIDPCVFLDRDGTAYLYYASRKIFVAKLKPSLLKIDSPPLTIDHLPPKGLIEGPFVFERNGIYYLTYPHVEHKTERLEYATARSPLGPFTPAGVILDEAESGCWTVHQSIVEYRGEWYLFYHDSDLSPAFDKNRSVRADRLSFNSDGTIQKVVPTLRGVGLVAATSHIQVDRYSAISPTGAAVASLDPAQPSLGWKLTLSGPAAWSRFNAVDFGSTPLNSIELRAASPTGGTIEIRLDRPDGPVLARIEIARTSDWQIARAPVKNAPTGVHDLFFQQTTEHTVELDWASFR